MKITKFGHACLLVEMPAPVNRTMLFDPGGFSVDALNVDTLEFLDDIFITHAHPEHMDVPLIQKLVAKFPDVRITGPREVVAKLKQENIQASSEELSGVEFFDSPHEDVVPLFDMPEQLGAHYLNLLTVPGDSHDIKSTKPVLALPMTGSWGAPASAMRLALQLKPAYVLPVHDWAWKDEARERVYDRFEEVLGKVNIQFVKLKTGEPVVLDVQPGAEPEPPTVGE